ncbi:glycosyltransferase family 2 protein [Novosphingobium tardum]|uniref:Glycosyltransferase family 2 protein n=1 Tax=Novosphingobium tardum TaxID=1538021 RepID=A0ABV8RLP6_9SPHN
MATVRPVSPALPPMDVTVIVIAFNEEIHIARCIERIRNHVKRVLIIDSFSTDRTREIASDLGAEVLVHPFVNHAAQFNWGMEAANVTTGWILRIDADEYVDAAGLDAIRAATTTATAEISAFSLRRGVVFAGRQLRFGGIGQVFLTRLWRTGMARIEARWMDEQVLVERGETRQIAKGAIIDENLNDIGWWTAKHNGYTTRQMVQTILGEMNRAAEIDLSQLNRHVRRKRILRQMVYSPSPLFVRAIGYFVYRYVFALGFLDGRAGFLFHFFQGLWNFFLVDVKIYEARAVLREGGTPAFKDWLGRVYGIDLAEI